MSTVYDRSSANVLGCHFDRRRSCFVPGTYCEFAREFYAAITAKQPKIARSRYVDKQLFFRYYFIMRDEYGYS